MKRICIVILLLLVSTVQKSFGWFEMVPGPIENGYYGRAIITRANSYETYPQNLNIFSTNTSMVGLGFFDSGDSNIDITVKYGGNPTDTFACAWPVTFYVWFQTNTSSVAEGGGYSEARLQYFQGTDTGNSNSWTNIAVITNFVTVNGIEGAHFGLVTWIPPATNNVYYLVRLWTSLNSGVQNASLESTHITKKGNGFDWHDYDVLLIKAIPYKKPGSRGIDLQSGHLGNPNMDDIGKFLLGIGRGRTHSQELCGLLAQRDNADVV